MEDSEVIEDSEAIEDSEEIVDSEVSEGEEVSEVLADLEQVRTARSASVTKTTLDNGK